MTFKKYADEINEVTRELFSKYRSAEKQLSTAKNYADNFPERFGIVTPDYEKHHAKSKADLIEAQDELRKAKINLEGGLSRIQEIRGRLQGAINETYGMNPEDIQSETMELLKSGVMKSCDYQALIDRSLKGGNYTMARIIGKYAEELSKSEDVNEQEARELRLASARANEQDGSKELQSFDYLATLYQKCVNNPSMIDEWDSLSSMGVQGLGE